MDEVAVVVNCGPARGVITTTPDQIDAVNEEFARANAAAVEALLQQQEKEAKSVALAKAAHEEELAKKAVLTEKLAERAANDPDLKMLSQLLGLLPIAPETPAQS